MTVRHRLGRLLSRLPGGLALVIAFAAAGAASAQPADTGKPPVLLGVSGPLTGQYA